MNADLGTSPALRSAHVPSAGGVLDEVPGRARRSRRRRGLDGAHPAGPAAGAGARRTAARGVTESVLALSSFDYEVSARAGVDATVAEPGRALVSGRLLAEITRSLPAQPVDMVDRGLACRLTCGSARFTLPTLPVEDYPTLPQMPGGDRDRRLRRVRRRGRPGRDRRRPRRHAAGADRRPGRDRGRPADPGGDRPLPARRPRAALAAGAAGHLRPSPWCRPAPWPRRRSR